MDNGGVGRFESQMGAALATGVRMSTGAPECAGVSRGESKGHRTRVRMFGESTGCTGVPGTENKVPGTIHRTNRVVRGPHAR